MRHDRGCRLLGIEHRGECPTRPDVDPPEAERTPVRRLTAKPEAIAARRLVGAHVNVVPDPPLLLPVSEHNEHMAIAQAKLSRALDLLAVLEPQCAGFAKPNVQAAIFEARAMLVEAGRRAPENRTPWVDRES